MSAHSAPAPDIRNYSALSRTDQRGVLRFLTPGERKELHRQVQLLRKPARKKTSAEIKQDLSPAFQQAMVRALAQAPGSSRYAMTPRAREALLKLLGTAAP